MYLNDVTEQLVDVPVSIENSIPLLALQAHAGALHQQVRVLAAGNLVIEHARRAALHAALEGLVLGAHLAPESIIRLNKFNK